MKNNKKRNLLLSLILAAVCIAFLLYVDKFQHYSMLATVLKKGAIYSLVAVSLNLLNGFTGLFSLGQAGFMMIGKAQGGNGQIVALQLQHGQTDKPGKDSRYDTR